MSAPNRSSFVYVTFIRTTPDKLWAALTEPEFINQYWFGMTIASAWQKGSPWTMSFPDGRLCDSGEILEVDPPRRMVIKWTNQWKPELTAEGPSRCTIELEPTGNAVKLTIKHEIERPDAKLINAVGSDWGWPRILSNLKSLLETGAVLALEDAKAL
jgi:uncharacterized protein YndB with AHSA1/START domain